MWQQLFSSRTCTYEIILSEWDTAVSNWTSLPVLFRLAVFIQATTETTLATGNSSWIEDRNGCHDGS
ncbi:hypothetical protein OUZ56_002226 [Daphnia magna]|uniref:Uncharacterized protein n=1 Tax=Daphnia magna TaxID=35525 RepID=A0ABR0A516_9CRUS|nr:hypothetical protein OUZ56_002226 [Daphnia magna]